MFINIINNNKRQLQNIKIILSHHTEVLKLIKYSFYNITSKRKEAK